MLEFTNRVTRLLQIRFPIIQAGMVWVSGWRLAAAVSNAGGLGIIGSGSMYPDVLRQHIRKCRVATAGNFAVNLPLLYPDIEKHIAVITEEAVPIVFTSAGNPLTWTGLLRSKGIIVVHVVSSTRFAIKAEQAGCHAVVAEGFEAGGHNGREESTTMVLVPAVAKAVSIPVIAAGGIAGGRQMLAAMVLGAEGVQMGTRFMLSDEASCHPTYKEMLLGSKEGDTVLSMKKLVPVRMIKNDFYREVATAEDKGASPEELQVLLGRGRAKKGMFEGDLRDGELEAGQVCAAIDRIQPAGEIVAETWASFSSLLQQPLLAAHHV